MGQISERNFCVISSLELHFNKGHEQAARQVHGALGHTGAALSYNDDGPHIAIPMSLGDGFKITESFAATVCANGGHFCASPIARFLNKVGQAEQTSPTGAGYQGAGGKRQSAFQALAALQYA